MLYNIHTGPPNDFNRAFVENCNNTTRCFWLGRKETRLRSLVSTRGGKQTIRGGSREIVLFIFFDLVREDYHTTDRYSFIHDCRLPDAKNRTSKERKQMATERSREEKWIEMTVGKKEKYFGVVTFHTAEDDAKELLHFPQMNKVSH